MSNKQNKKFYDSAAWQKVRMIALTRDSHLCQVCAMFGRVKIGDTVDHIRPLSTHPDRSLDLDNLQTICRCCHTKKTTADMRDTRYVCIHGVPDGENLCEICLTES